jgi:TRAP-type C4-dicarboxylate transport system permease small subunit
LGGIIGKAANLISRLEMGSRRINAIIMVGCSVFLFIIVIYVVSDITGRYLFLNPLPGTVEITQSLLVFVIFLSLTSVMIKGRHIRVGILLDRFPPRWRAWLEILALAVGFSLMLLMSWRTLDSAIYSYEIRELPYVAGGAGGFPLLLYPSKFALFAGCALFSIHLFIQFLSHIFARLAAKASTSKES